MITVKSEEIKSARLNLGWSSMELAKRAGCTNETVRRVERGCSPTPKTAKKISDALGKPVTSFFAIE